MNEPLHQLDGPQGPPVPLTHDGRIRRDAMLGHLLEEAQRLRRRRTAWRAAGVLGLCLLLAAGSWWAVGGSASPRPAPAPLADASATEPVPVASIHPSQGEASEATHRRVSMLDTDVGIKSRLAFDSGPFERTRSIDNALRVTRIEPACRVELMNDVQLARALSDMGRPMTVARSRDRVWLIAHRDSAEPRL